MIDWVVSKKEPERIAVLGVSMGGATALAEAVGDARVDALILDSTHATLANALQARLDAAGYPLSLPGSWAILLGSLLRTGQDISSVDPMQTIGSYARPLLIIVGGGDDSIGRRRPGPAGAAEAGDPRPSSRFARMRATANRSRPAPRITATGC